MPMLFCSPRLWRAIDRPARRNRIIQSAHGGTCPQGKLGNWAATIVTEKETPYVLALTIDTNLTVVFPLEPQNDFTRRFHEALAVALEDLSIPIPQVVAECAAIWDVELAYLRGGGLLEPLAYTKWFCQTEFSQHESARNVQASLNLLRRPHLGATPAMAVRSLLGVGDAVAIKVGL
jgi:hypothetical protein